jgi:hypothetical protein
VLFPWVTYSQGLGDGCGKLFAVLERGGEQKILFFAQILFQVLWRRTGPANGSAFFVYFKMKYSILYLKIFVYFGFK